MITQKIHGLERIVRFRPAWHKVNADPKKDYGVHGMEIHFILKGPKGAVHFLVSTGMMLAETYEWWEKTGRGSIPHRIMSMGIDVGYHSPKKMWDGQEVRWPTKIRKKNPKLKSKDPGKQLLNFAFDKIGKKPPVCEYLGKPCYSDGSAMRAQDWFEVFKKEGDDKIWAMMEGEYKALFGGKK